MACVASAAITGLTPALRAAGAVAGDPARAFDIGLQSFTLRRFAFEPMLDVLVSLGVRKVELIPELGVFFYRFGSHFPVTDDPAEIDRVRAAMAKRGLQISASGVHSIPDEAEARRLFDFAERAGIPLLTISPDDGALDAIDRLCRERPGIRVGIHNHGPWTRYDTIADVEASLAGRAPNFGACVDTGHFIRSGEDPVEALRRLGARVHGVHLKDHVEAGFFASGCLLGEGRLDLVACFRALREIGFRPDGALSLELERDGDTLLEDVKTCLRSAERAAAEA
ncbi:MAG: sugar phosphate isomerase/epimerase [Myxococcota bacterium]